MPHKLGFGTSGIMGAAMTDRGRLNLLDQCWDLGITHFDTAPLYGRGEAERLLGKFLKRKPQSVTVTTKFGLPSNEVPIVLKPLMPIVRVANRALINARKKKANAITHRVTSSSGEEENQVQSTELIPQDSQFDVNSIENELDRSLKKLGRDWVDYYLFHECDAYDVSDAVLAKLNDLQAKGKIAKYGLATGTLKTAQILSKHNDFNGVIQVPFNVNFQNNLTPGNVVFVHSVVNQASFYDKVHCAPAPSQSVLAQISKRGIDMSEFDLALISRFEQINRFSSIEKTLFSSSRKNHIAQFVALYNAYLDGSNESFV